jgi:hypothetical protein
MSALSALATFVCPLLIVVLQLWYNYHLRTEIRKELHIGPAARCLTLGSGDGRGGPAPSGCGLNCLVARKEQLGALQFWERGGLEDLGQDGCFRAEPELTGWSDGTRVLPTPVAVSAPSRPSCRCGGSTSRRFAAALCRAVGALAPCG